MLVFRRDAQSFKFLLAQRFGEASVWQFPQGGVEPNDSLEASVYRELHEELGAQSSNFKIFARLKHTHRYDFKIPPAYAIGRFRGQEQSFWLVEFLADDSLLTLASEHPEFMAFCWCSADEVRSRADPVRRAGYEGALREAVELLCTNVI